MAEPASDETSAHKPRRWLVPVLAGMGGLMAGAALAGLGVVALGSLLADDALKLAAEPLGAETPGTAMSAPATATPSGIVVDVAGAVAQPGLHHLGVGARVGDAIEAAGGFAPRADLAATSQSLNLAQPLADGSKVLVPALGVDGVPATVPAEDRRVDLNRAGQAALESLPGIGPVTARKIIDARDERRFGSVRDLRSRGLVGESVFEDLKDLVHAD